MYTIYSYAAYLFISIVLTVWVGQTLYRRGRVFVIDAFRGNESLADSVNHLLIVGFYLVNIGLVALAMKYGEKPRDVQGSLEWLTTKVGLVLVVLGGMHFFNVFNLAKMRHKGLHPVPPASLPHASPPPPPTLPPGQPMPALNPVARGIAR